MKINDRVKEIRLKVSLNQQGFADRLGLTQGQVSRIEKGGNAVTEQNIKAICTTFNVREEWLREGKGEMFLSSKETLINRLKNELHLNDTEIAILNIYAELPQEDRDSIIKFAQRASTLFIAAPAPPADAPPVSESDTLADEPALEDLTDEEKEILRQLRLEKSTKTSAASPSIA